MGANFFGLLPLGRTFHNREAAQLVAPFAVTDFQPHSERATVLFDRGQFSSLWVIPKLRMDQRPDLPLLLPHYVRKICPVCRIAMDVQPISNGVSHRCHECGLAIIVAPLRKEDNTS